MKTHFLDSKLFHGIQNILVMGVLAVWLYMFWLVVSLPRPAGHNTILVDLVFMSLPLYCILDSDPIDRLRNKNRKS